MKLALIFPAVLLLAGCSSSGHAVSKPKPHVPTFNVSGHVTIFGQPDQTLTVSGRQCAGAGSAGGFVDGAAVTVTDVRGAQLAAGTLSGGSVGSDTTACVFSVSVRGVPDGQAFYRMDIGGRGAEQYAASKLKAPLDLAYLVNAP